MKQSPLATYRITVLVDSKVWATLGDEKLGQYDDTVVAYLHELQTKLGAGFSVEVSE